MLQGRLGLDTARVPHADREGLLWLARGILTVRDGVLVFARKGASEVGDALAPGNYTIPFQTVSLILLGPGSSVSHDALRLMARHGTALAAVGVDGVRLYTAPPLVGRRSELARKQAIAWADPDRRLDLARRMYAWRLGEITPQRDIAALRGLEGARMRQSYRLIAAQVGIQWKGRRYDRSRPDAADLPNQALNHTATAVEAAAAIAVTATATIPQLGFVHEDPSQSFVLDVSDLFRHTVTIPAAFRAAKKVEASPFRSLERTARREVGETMAKEQTIPKMIERIKKLFEDVEIST